MKSFFSLILIIASVAVFVVVIKPQYEALQQARLEVASSASNLETASKVAESREALINTYNGISKSDLDNLKALFPDSVNNIRLIIQINSLATKNGLSLLRNVDYQTDQQTETSSDAAKRQYGEFSISFQTSGQYKNFLTFLNDLERNLRLVDVTKVEFTGVEGTSAQTLAGNISYKVTLKTYWLKQ